MAIDWGSVAAGAGTGALAGGAAGGIGAPIGALIGGGSALIGSLLSPKSDVPAFQDLSDPRMSAIAQALIRKKLGAQGAARQKALNTRNANMSMEKFDNDPNAGAISPSQRVGAYNAINRSAEESNVSANLSGAEQDQNAMTKASSIIEANNQLSLQRNQFARQGWQLDQQPSAFQSLAGTALSNTLGQFVQSKLNPKPTGVNPPTPEEGSDIANKSAQNAAPPPDLPSVSAPASSAYGQSEWDSQSQFQQNTFGQDLMPQKKTNWGNGGNYYDRLMQRYAPQPAY